MRINTNAASLAAQNSVSNTNSNLSSSLEKLGTGLRINKAADDVAGVAIADKLRTQAASIGQGINNANSASALIQIADQAMSEQSNILNTVKTKLIQASTDTTNADGREAIRKDIKALLTQFDAIASQTNYNGTTLLQKSSTDTSKLDDLSFQLGENSAFDVKLAQTSASNTSALGGGSETITTGRRVQLGDSLKLTGMDAISLTSQNVATDDSEAAATAVFLNLSVSGTLGMVTAAEDITLDFSAATDAQKTALESVAIGSAGGAASWDAATNVFTMADGETADFSGMNFDSVVVEGVVDAAVKFDPANLTDTISITNLNPVDLVKSQEGIINVGITGDAVGGHLLGDLKNLAVDGLTTDLANTHMATIDEALIDLNKNRSDFGSTQNQIDSNLKNMRVSQVNIQAAESVIRDVDYAAESANFNKLNIMAQAGTYAISQANAASQNVMRLLQ